MVGPAGVPSGYVACTVASTSPLNRVGIQKEPLVPVVADSTGGRDAGRAEVVAEHAVLAEHRGGAPGQEGVLHPLEDLGQVGPPPRPTSRFDQRGCARSTPHTSDPATDVRHNTTHRPIADMERLRQQADGVSRDEDVVAAYARLMEHPDDAVREKTTTDWCAWEDAVLSGETGGAFSPYGGRPEEGVLLRKAGRLAGIPGVLVHGRQDMGNSLDTAWRLHRAWPGPESVVVEGAEHLGSATTRDHVLQALDRFAAVNRLRQRTRSSRQNLPESRQIWFFLVLRAPAGSHVHWWMRAPGAVETSLTSTHLPLWTATSW